MRNPIDHIYSRIIDFFIHRYGGDVILDNVLVIFKKDSKLEVQRRATVTIKGGGMLLNLPKSEVLKKVNMFLSSPKLGTK